MNGLDMEKTSQCLFFPFFFKWIKIEGLEKSWLMYGGDLQYWSTVIKKVILLFLFFFRSENKLKKHNGHW